MKKALRGGGLGMDLLKHGLTKEELAQIRKDRIAELAFAEVDPPKGYETGKRKRIQFKECYPTALNYVLYLPEENRSTVTLVHGFCVKHGAPYGHAWVELPGEVVFDGVMQRFYDKAGYYQAKRCTDTHRYTLEEACELFLKHNHYGPWEPWELALLEEKR
jgi:hypothetical protein